MRVRRGELGLGVGYPGDVSYARLCLTAMTRITIPRDGFCKEIPTAAVWAAEARVDANGTYFGVVRHGGVRSTSRAVRRLCVDEDEVN